MELLHTIAEVLDVRAIFPRVSMIAREVLPHDFLGLLARESGDHFTLEARSDGGFPAFRSLAFSGTEEFQIIDDLSLAQSDVVAVDPPDLIAQAVAAGYRSLLNIRSAMPNRALGLGFL
jgi:hypothetical protein